MEGDTDVAVKIERGYSELSEARRRRENWIGLLGWLIVMILASVSGFWIGYLAKYGF